MTLCVGIERKGRVWIGADSARSQGNHVDSSPTPKVWRSNGWVIAGAGLWHAINIVRLTARLPEPRDETSVAIGVAGEIRRALDAAGVRYAQDDNDDDDWEDNATDWLVGAHGIGLWMIDGAFDSAKYREWAIGHDDYALGWLDGSAITAPELRVKECITACSKRMPGAVRLPVTVLEA